MRLDHQFEVQAPITEVWSALIDIERVAPCLPGAEIAEGGEDGTYRGEFKVKLGPTTAAYSGTLRMESLDEDAHVATMRAEGRDKRGQGSAKATIVSRMTESAGTTRVEVETDFSITGKLARFGRGGMIEDIADRLLGEFARCLQSGFEGPATIVAEPDPAGDPPPDEPAGPAAHQTTPAGEILAHPYESGEAGHEPAEGGETLAPSERRFTPPAASKPISGVGLVGSVVLGRVAPVLLRVVRGLQRLLGRLERALAGPRR